MNDFSNCSGSSRDDQSAESQAQILLEKIAGDLVTSELDDLPALAQIHSCLQELQNLIKNSNPDVAEWVSRCADLVEKMVQGDITDLKTCQTFLTEGISAIQLVIRDNKNAAEVSFPVLPSSDQPKTDTSAPAENIKNKSTESNTIDDSPQIPASDLILSFNSADSDLIAEFITEAREHCTIAEQMIMELESGGGDEDPINAIFRSFHTIKGAAAILNLKPLAILAHESETLLDLARKGTLTITDRIADIIFEALDNIGQLLTATEQGLANGQPYDASNTLRDIISRLKNICANPEAEQTGESEDEPDDRVGDILVEMGTTSKSEIENALALNKMPDERIGTSLVKQGVVSAKSVAGALRLQKKLRGSQAGSGAGVKEVVKIDTNRLDSLVDTIGELVIAESMVGQDDEFLATVSPRIAKNVAHLNKITRELQSMGMAMRLVPVRPTFQKLARAVRDLNRVTGKKIELVMSGEDTEVDRGIIEKIGDPLMHMVRNAADHAIEEPKERKETGKGEVGKIWLRAYHKGGNIYFQVEDDGRGLDKEKILAKARERGLVDGRKELSEREIFELIMQPGFSTAKTVTDVSGRGVGMDVVKKNIDAMRGTLDIQSQLGSGTIFTIRLPLTLAIIDGMLIGVRKERFIIPTISVLESVQLTEDIIKTINVNKEVIHIRGKLYPIIRLAELFDLPVDKERSSEGIVIIVDDGGKKVGLVVDELLGLRQTVIKNLGPVFADAKWFSGGAILSDGNVGLIIDITGIIELANHLQNELVVGHTARSNGLDSEDCTDTGPGGREMQTEIAAGSSLSDENMQS
ncbi:MAG: chemotaxis protein CheA [Candidatus Zixiibacteriota bacterium]